MNFFRFSSLTIGFLTIFLISGCGIVGKDKTMAWSVQKLYDEAKQELDGGSYKTSRGHYNKLLSRFPFGRYAQQAHLDMIQLEYKDKEYDKAVAKADKFLQIYPRSQYADYARYMKGIIAYSRDVSIIDRLVPTNIAQSDQAMMKEAYDNFEALVAKSKDSDYAEDAKMRMVYLRNVSAEHEIYVAEYYLRKGNYIAAVNRGKNVLQNYQTTPSTPLALAVMVRGYYELKEPELAADSKSVLEKNFPNIAKTSSRANHILNGDITSKPGFFSRITQELLN